MKYRPKSKDSIDWISVAILPHLSKVYKMIIYKQIDKFMRPKLLPYLCGFSKNSNSWYYLLKIIEFWKQHLVKGNLFDVLIMNLSKPSDNIKRSFLFGKLEAYGFSGNSFKLLQSYLNNRFQRMGRSKCWILVGSRVT